MMPFIAIDFIATFASIINAIMTLAMGDFYGWGFAALCGLHVYFLITLISVYEESKEKYQYDLDAWRRNVWKSKAKEMKHKNDQIVQNYC